MAAEHQATELLEDKTGALGTDVWALKLVIGEHMEAIKELWAAGERMETGGVCKSIAHAPLQVIRRCYR